MSILGRLPFMVADPTAEMQQRVETLEATVADLDARLSALEESATSPNDDGGEGETGAQARARISAILALPEAKAHPELAQTLALNGLSVALARQALAAAGGAPEAQVKGGPRGYLDAAMRKIGSPQLGTGGSDPLDFGSSSDRLSRMADAYLGKGA